MPSARPPLGRNAGGAPLLRRWLLGGRALGANWSAGAGVLMGPIRLLVVCVALAGLLAVALARIGPLGGGQPVGARVVASVTFEHVGYGLLGVNVAKRIAQRGGAAVSASGVFIVLKLRLHSVDGRPHAISADLFALDASGTYYGASSPDDIGLSDRQWGAVRDTTQVPADGSLTVKVLFDLSPGAVRHPLALHIGQSGFAVQGSGQILDLTHRVACCSTPTAPPATSRHPEMLGRLLPDPVLGFLAIP